MQHPSNSYDPPCLSLGVSPPPTLKLGHKTSPSTVTENLDSVNTLATSNTVTDTPVITPPGAKLPVYSYKNYKPSPTVVYTQHEEEANDLIGGLKAGHVFQKIYRLLILKYYFKPCSSRHWVAFILPTKNSRNFIYLGWKTGSCCSSSGFEWIYSSHSDI